MKKSCAVCEHHTIIKGIVGKKTTQAHICLKYRIFLGSNPNKTTCDRIYIKPEFNSQIATEELSIKLKFSTPRNHSCTNTKTLTDELQSYHDDLISGLTLPKNLLFH